MEKSILLAAALLAIGAEFARADNPHPVRLDVGGSPKIGASGRNCCRTAATSTPAATASAYEGRNEIPGTDIEYGDDSRFTTDGDFVELDVLRHGGMILYRK